MTCEIMFFGDHKDKGPSLFENVILFVRIIVSSNCFQLLTACDQMFRFNNI